MVLLLLSVGCLSGAEPAPDQASETVALSLTYRDEWRNLWIEGETDLPDGAVVAYQVIHEIAETTSVEEWPAKNLIDSGNSTVRDGTYWTEVNTTYWPRGNVRLLVQFPVAPQPAVVAEQYGQFGERLAGDNVVSMGEMKVVEVEETFEHRP